MMIKEDLVYYFKVFFLYFIMAFCLVMAFPIYCIYRVAKFFQEYHEWVKQQEL